MSGRPRAARSDARAVLYYLLAAALIVAAGVNGLFGWPNDQLWRIPVRAVVAGAAVAFFLRAVVLWARSHAVTVAPATVPHSDLQALRGPDLIRFLNARVQALHLERPQKTTVMADALRGTSAVRARVQEEQRVDGDLVHWRVTLHLRDAALTDLGLDRDVVLLTRRDRSDGYGRTEGHWGDGSAVSLLTLAEAASLTWFVMCAAILHLPASLHTDLRELFARCVASESNDTKVLGDAQHLLREVPAADKEPVLLLVEAIATRRPIYAWAPQAEEAVGRVTFTYVSNLSRIRPVSRDWWRSFKDALRRRFYLPPTLFTLNMERASSAESYSLEVTVPEGLYIDESEFVDEDMATLAETPKNSISAVFLGKSNRNGREDIRVFAWNLGEARPAVRPRLLVRVLERPPGSLASAWLVALAVTTTTWLTGVVTAVSLRHQQHPTTLTAGINRLIETLSEVGPGSPTDLTDADQPFSTGVDLAALAVVLPGLLAAWLGIAFTRARGDYRSITGLLSLVVSAGLALASIVTYVGRFAVGRIVGMDFDASRTWFFLGDWLSAGLLLAATLNFFTVAGLAFARHRRYRQLRSADRERATPEGP